MSISIANLTFSYGDHVVLDRVSFDVPTGALVNALGPNGVGKSTLFRCILGLEQSWAGTILVDGVDLRGLTPRERARRIAFIPQTHSALYDYSALDTVLMSTTAGLGSFASPGEPERERAWNALERVGIAHLAHRSAARLSGGEQQLVLIARALAQDARAIVMDEPTSALDYGNTVRILGCIRDLSRDGYTIIQSTHQPDQAFLFADRVLALEHGRVAAFGDPDTVITEELVKSLYGVDVKICSLFGDRVRTCVPVVEIWAEEGRPSGRECEKRKDRI